MITSICNVDSGEQKRTEDILVQFAKDKSSITILFPTDINTENFIEISNSSGRTIYYHDLGCRIKSVIIKIKNLTRGIYLLHVYNKDNMISQQFSIN